MKSSSNLSKATCLESNNTSTSYQSSAISEYVLVWFLGTNTLSPKAIANTALRKGVDKLKLYVQGLLLLF